MKLKEFREREVCAKELEFEKMGYSTPKGISYYKAIASRKIVKELIMAKQLNLDALKEKLKGDYIKDNLDKNIPDRLFLPLSKEQTIEDLSKEIKRFGYYLLELNTKVLRADIVEDVLIEGELVRVKADFILKHKDFIEVCILRNSAPELSYRGQKPSTMVDLNPELYILAQLGKKLYPKENSAGAIYSLTSKGDKKNNFDEIYELKKGRNRVSCTLGELKKEKILTRINEIIKGENLGTVSSNCFMCKLKGLCEYEGEESINLIPIDEGPKASSGFSLTKDQKEAVIANEGVFRINAGAGSGKTTVVALRVVELLSQGTNPEDILLITFTNKGAKEMREKISYWLKEEMLDISIDALNIETFNSWGDTIIKKHYKYLEFSKEPRLLEKVDKIDILFDILDKYPRLKEINYKNPLLNLRYAKGSVVELSNRIDSIKSLSLEYSEEEYEFTFSKETFELYEIYNKKLKELNLIEYQDQVNLALKLIQSNKVDISYEHIIVDEFQDTDITQIDLIKELSGMDKFKSLMVVGDDSQAIFGFRNTSQENILNFHKEFDSVEDIFLVDNFRSTPEIIALANAVNNLNDIKIDKTLVSHLPYGNKPVLVLSETVEDEANVIVDHIKKALIDSNPSDIAIIARTKVELFSIKDRLVTEGIPFIFDIPEPLINNINIQVASSLVEYLSLLDGNKGIFEYLFVKNNGFKDMKEDEVKSLILEMDKEIKERIENSEDIEEKRLEIFYELTDELKDLDFRKFMDELKNDKLSFFKIHEYITKLVGYEDPRAIERNEQKYDAVTLTTAHTSKGKEFDKVFVLMSKFTPKKNAELQEEIRVFFVAITRAKKELFISTNNTKSSSDLFFKKILEIDGGLWDRKRTF